MGHCFSSCVSKTVKPCTICFGDIPTFFAETMSIETRNTLHNEIKKISKPGYFILSFIKGRASNLFITGSPYTHLGIIDGNHIIDMVSEGVRKTPIKNWIYNKHKLLILKIPSLTDLQLNQIVLFARKTLEHKTPYDFSFVIDDDAMYCTEFGYMALRSIDDTLPFTLGITPSIEDGLLQSTLFKANSFIKPIKTNKIEPVLEWRLNDSIGNIYNINTKRLFKETFDPVDQSITSGLLYEMTKLAFPFHEPRLKKIKEAVELQQNKKCCVRRKKSRAYFRTIPSGDLIRKKITIKTQEFNNIFQDEKTREIYISVSYIFSHKWIKLVSYDAIHGIPEALGSSEIMVPTEYISKDKIPQDVINFGSYNYKDLTIAGNLDHFWADVM